MRGNLPRGIISLCREMLRHCDDLRTSEGWVQVRNRAGRSNPQRQVAAD